MPAFGYTTLRLVRKATNAAPGLASVSMRWRTSTCASKINADGTHGSAQGDRRTVNPQHNFHDGGGRARLEHI